MEDLGQSVQDDAPPGGFSYVIPNLDIMSVYCRSNAFTASRCSSLIHAGIESIIAFTNSSSVIVLPVSVSLAVQCLD